MDHWGLLLLDALSGRGSNQTVTIDFLRLASFASLFLSNFLSLAHVDKGKEEGESILQDTVVVKQPFTTSFV